MMAHERVSFTLATQFRYRREGTSTGVISVVDSIP